MEGFGHGGDIGGEAEAGMKVNIVMLAKDRPRLLGQTLDTLYRNTPSELYNLTVVDDESRIDRGAGSNAPALVETLTGNMSACSLRIGHSKGITGQARNLGVYWAEKYWGRGDYLYLSDNDVYFTPGWLPTLIDTFEDDRCQPIIKLLGGWNHAYMQPNWKSTPWPDKNGRQVATHDAVTGASQLMKWETWDKYGPLDAHAKGVCQGEDWQMCQNIIKDGGRVGSIYPRVVFNCGLTNSFGVPSVGADVVLKELQQAKMTYTDLYYE